jgi:hypothetical protein
MGKNSNLDMLKDFFKIETDNKGNFNIDCYNNNIKLFKWEKLITDYPEIKILRELNIWTENLIYQGKYHAIFIEFGDIREANFTNYD